MRLGEEAASVASGLRRAQRFLHLLGEDDLHKGLIGDIALVGERLQPMQQRFRKTDRNRFNRGLERVAFFSGAMSSTRQRCTV